MAAEETFCLFRCESAPLAVAIANVAEIAEVDRLVRISLCPPRVAGLCTYHRQVVPVVNLGKQPSFPVPPEMDHRTSVKKQKETVLILQAAQGMWGIVIDREGTTLTSQRPLRHDPREDDECVVTVGRIEHHGTSHGLLETDSTWARLRTSVVNWYALINQSLSMPEPMIRAQLEPS